MREISDIDQIETLYCDTDEQETSINIYRNSDEVRIYTSDNTMITKLSKVFDENKDTWKCFECDRDSSDRASGYLFITNKKSISFRNGKGRQLSDEERERARERFIKYHKEKHL